MLKLVNEELLSFSTTIITDKHNGKSYTKIRIANSNRIFRYRDNQVESFGEKSHNAPHDNNTVGVLNPLNLEIMRVSAPLKEINEAIDAYRVGKPVNFDLPMSLNVKNNNGKPWVEVRCHEEGQDNASVYLVAFPFNGMISPIPKDPRYRIYKGVIASSAKPLYFNNRKYRKVLYLIIGVNNALFNESHKYHTDKIDIQLESYSLLTNRDTSQTNTTKETMVFNINSPVGDYDVKWKYETLDEAVMINTPPGTQLWEVFTFDKNNNDHRPNKRFNKGSNGQRPSVREGDMVVTSNKNGIRKEIPVKKKFQHNHNNPNYHKTESKANFESMMDKALNEDRGKKENRSSRKGTHGKRKYHDDY